MLVHENDFNLRLLPWFQIKIQRLIANDRRIGGSEPTASAEKPILSNNGRWKTYGSI